MPIIFIDNFFLPPEICSKHKCIFEQQRNIVGPPEKMFENTKMFGAKHFFLFGLKNLV